MSQAAKVSRLRRTVQWLSAGLVAVIGLRFTLWVAAHMSGQWPSVSRPPGVEAFLPIDAMISLRLALETGLINPVHPAGLAIFLGICLMSLVLARSFCSHLCPFGLLSELLGRLGQRLLGRTLQVPRWLDVPLRGLKLLLLGFFVWAIWFAMSPKAVAAFVHGPYVRVVDAKMWLLFAEPTRLTAAVLGILVAGSILVRDLWCRYLCPYGALVGLLGRLAPLKPTRNPELCTDCRACTRVCPARLPVHTLTRVSSIECTSCQDCVIACPVGSCLAVRPAPRQWPLLRPVVASLTAVALFLLVITGFRAAGYWHTSISEAEYHHRLQEINAPLYSHPGATAAR